MREENNTLSELHRTLHIILTTISLCVCCVSCGYKFIDIFIDLFSQVGGPILGMLK